MVSDAKEKYLVTFIDAADELLGAEHVANYGHTQALQVAEQQFFRKLRDPNTAKQVAKVVIELV